jgi:hypothetical protein
MELMFDWRSFQTVFHPPRRSNSEAQKDAGQNAYLVVDGDRIIAAYAEQENLQDWIGASLTEIRRQNPHRTLKVVQKGDVHRALEQGLGHSQFYDQVEHFRQSIRESADSGTDFSMSHPHHFLVEALRGWWARFLPTHYGLCLQLTTESGSVARTVLLLARRGKLEGFHDPDLSAFHASGRRNPEELAKYLTERYMAPVRVATIPQKLWATWSQDVDPWADVFRAMVRKQIAITPASAGIKSLIAARTVI